MLPLSLSNSLAALVLLCAVLQICQGRLPAMLKFSQFAAFVLGMTTFWQAVVRKEDLLYGAGFLILFVQAWLLPNALRRIIIKFSVPVEVKQAFPVVWSMLIGLLSVCVAILAGMPSIKIPVPPEAGIMAVALAIILLGIWLVIIQTQILAQIVGVLTVENGLVLALIHGCTQSWVIVLVLFALLSIVACLIFLANKLYAEKIGTTANGANL